jgi:hypothetical protein
VDLATGFLDMGNSFQKSAALEKCTAFDIVIDSGKILLNDSACTEINMANFAIANLAFWQSNR